MYLLVCVINCILVISTRNIEYNIGKNVSQNYTKMYAREKVASDFSNSENMTTYLLPPVFSHEDPLCRTSDPWVQTLFKIGFQIRLFFFWPDDT